MATKLLPIFLVWLVTLCFLGSLVTQDVKATTTNYATFQASNNDGDVYYIGSGYGSTRNATTGYHSDTTTTFRLGQTREPSFPSYIYSLYRGMVLFDTSTLPSDANITSVILSLYVSANYSITDFNVTIQSGAPTYPHDSLENGDYYHNWYSGNGGNRNTSTISALSYWNVTLNSSGIAWINDDGITKLCLRSSRDINCNTPTGNEYITIYASEGGASYAPKLYVTYTTPDYTNVYTIHGPYYEDGSVADCYVNVSMTSAYASPVKFGLNGTDGVADTVTESLMYQPTAFTWNVSVGTNHTRVYYLKYDESYEELYIYVPKPTDPTYLYTFTVISMPTITHPYLESIINVGGSSRVVERQSLSVISAAPFYMIWSNKYDMRLICDDGSYTWAGFVALSEQNQNLVVTMNMFPMLYPGSNVTVTADRLNATYINCTYIDNQSKTIWCYMAVQYRSGSTYVNAYSVNATGQTHTLNWNSAASATDYRLYVYALRSDGYQTWTFSLPKMNQTTNPWTGLFESLGSWPIDASQLPAMLVVLFVFGCFSYADAAVGCGMGVLAAAGLWYMGWLNISYTLLGVGFVLVVFMFIAEYRRSRRLEGLDA